MTIPSTWEPLTDADPVLTIAQDLFSTMIDGEPGYVYPWMGENPTLEDPTYTWVDVAGPVDGGYREGVAAVPQVNGESLSVRLS